jgi:type II secretory pathway predicted ATPase ExeA
MSSVSFSEDLHGLNLSRDTHSTSQATCLRELRIKDFALVAEDVIYFQQGLNVITGESGSGKSVLVSAAESQLTLRLPQIDLKPIG